jgi:type III pantothenate kinase
MILQIDAGNTRIKWRVIEGSRVGIKGSEAVDKGCRTVDKGGRTVAEGTQLTTSILAGEPLLLPTVTALTMAQLSNVAGDTVIATLSKQLRAQFAISLQVAKVSPQVGLVSCGYTSPDTLGIDRWLVVLAAFEKTGRAAVVVDAGSALTVDIVNSEGVHQGGYIVPGVRLLQESLWQGTDQVKVDQSGSGEPPIPGVTTEQAVSHGCILMLAAFIERLVAEHRAELIITGGDALLLKSQLAVKADYCPDLVLDGLSVEGLRFTFWADK